MKIKRLLICLLLIAPLAHAEDTPFSSSLKGVHVVPMSKLNLPLKMKNELFAKKSEETIKGYQETDGQNAQYLLNIKQSSVQQLKASNGKNYGVYDTHLKSTPSAIKLAFPFKGVSGISGKDVIGYAAIGSFEKNGWNGIREIFSSNEMGNCSFSHMKIIAVELAKETTEYFVNKKPSNKMIEGNQNSGFLYTINWYTNNGMNTLECANKSFKPVIMDKMVVLANQIDKA